MVEQGRTEKLGRVWNKTNIIDNLYSWKRKLRSFDNRSPVKMWTDTILIALLLHAMTTSEQQTKRFVDCEKSQCVLPKSRETNFQSKNQTLKYKKYIHLIRRFVVVSLSIFTSCAVFWRARRASQNTNNE